MLAAVAIAITLPHIGDFDIGGINAGPFAVMFLGGFIGLIIMRFAAQWFVKVLKRLPITRNSCIFNCRMGRGEISGFCIRS